MAELILKDKPDGTIYVEISHNDNNPAEIGIMLASAMAKDIEFASMICSAIPTFLDMVHKSRESYCETVIKAQGLNNDKKG